MLVCYPGAWPGFEKGWGLFWKSEKCANDLDSNFHWSWINFRRFVQNLRRNVSESSKIQSFFPPKIRWSPKKKKKNGLRQNSEWFFGRNPKFKAFFPNIRWSPKKNKKVFTKIEAAISSNFANSDVWGGLFSNGGGLFSIFHIKSASKAQKACDFAYFTSQWGGSSPPPPHLATLLLLSYFWFYVLDNFLRNYSLFF